MYWCFQGYIDMCSVTLGIYQSILIQGKYEYSRTCSDNRLLYFSKVWKMRFRRELDISSRTASYLPHIFNSTGLSIQ